MKTAEDCTHNSIMYINSEIGWLCLDCKSFATDKKEWKFQQFQSPIIITDEEIEDAAKECCKNIPWNGVGRTLIECFKKDTELMRSKLSIPKEESKWISVNDKEPEEFQNVMFVVKSKDEFYDGKVLGGTYQGKKGKGDYRHYAFSTPGIEWEGIFWQPSPFAPTK